MGSTSRPTPSVTAVHNHMLDDEPRLFFMHFQRRSPAARQGAARGALSSEGGEGVIARPAGSSACEMSPAADQRRIILARSLRAFADGYVAILLPVHLSLLGFEAFAVGAIATAALLGSALLTLALGIWRTGSDGVPRC